MQRISIILPLGCRLTVAVIVRLPTSSSRHHALSYFSTTTKRTHLRLHPVLYFSTTTNKHKTGPSPLSSTSSTTSSAPSGAEFVPFSLTPTAALDAFKEYHALISPLPPQIIRLSPVFFPFWVYSNHLSIYAGARVPRDIAKSILLSNDNATPFNSSLLRVGAPVKFVHDDQSTSSSSLAGIEPFALFEARAWSLVSNGPRKEKSVSSRRLYCPGYEIDYVVGINTGNESQILRAYVGAGSSDDVMNNVWGTAGEGRLASMYQYAITMYKNNTHSMDASDLIRSLFRINRGDPRAVGGLLILLFQGSLRLLFWPPFYIAAATATLAATAAATLGPSHRQRRVWEKIGMMGEEDRIAQIKMTDEWLWRGEEENATTSFRKKQTKQPPPVDENDFYAVLNISSEASQAEIINAFRQQLLRFHPDHSAAMGLSESVASERTRIIIKAYSELRNPVKRKAYDDSKNKGGRRERERRDS
jgi:DnaJ-domain-containing protein 1